MKSLMFNRDSLGVRMNLFAKWKYFCEFRDGNININVMHYGKNNSEAHSTTYNRMNVRKLHFQFAIYKYTCTTTSSANRNFRTHFSIFIVDYSLWFPPSDSAHVVLPNNYLTHRFLTSPLLLTQAPTTDLFSCETLFGRAWHCKNCRFTFHPLLWRKAICLKLFHFQQGGFSRDLLGTRSHSLFFVLFFVLSFFFFYHLGFSIYMVH